MTQKYQNTISKGYHDNQINKDKIPRLESNTRTLKKKTRKMKKDYWHDLLIVEHNVKQMPRYIKHNNKDKIPRLQSNTYQNSQGKIPEQ